MIGYGIGKETRKQFAISKNVTVGSGIVLNANTPVIVGFPAIITSTIYMAIAVRLQLAWIIVMQRPSSLVSPD